MPRNASQLRGMGVMTALLVVALAGGVGCGDTTLTTYHAPFQVVDGTPGVDQSLPKVDKNIPQVNAGDFANNAPIQIDTFYQKTVRKVDILWVVDSSGSMQDKQAKLANNFQTFIQNLSSAQPPVDYHLGIITVDATLEGGALRPVNGDPSTRYIACDATGHCNVADPTAAFVATVKVGTGGSPIEKGLLAAHLALTDPMKSGTNAGFLRDDAALYVIIVSDEGDASCQPLVDTPSGSDWTNCHFSPYCRCAADASLQYGAVSYYTRFFDGLKGFGNSDMTAVATIVGTDQTPETVGFGPSTYNVIGCKDSSGAFAFYAPRYVQVAKATGGITVSICDNDYSKALAKLGFAVSGQRRDFPLSRSPVDPTKAPITVYVQSDPTNPATRKQVPQSITDGWTWVKCESTNFLNVIRFSGTWVPPPQARIEVTYQVDPAAGKTCP